MIKAFFSTILGSLLLLSVGCGTLGNSGRLDKTIESAFPVQSSDRIIFRSKENRKWLRTSLDQPDAKAMELFNSDLDLKDATSDGKIILLLDKMRYGKDSKHSDLYVYNSGSDQLTEISLPESGYQYDSVSLSPNGKSIIASASTPNFYKPRLYDDTVYLIDVQKTTIKKLKNYWGNAEVSWMYWSLDGNFVFHTITTCGGLNGGDCKSAELKRDPFKNTVEEVETKKTDFKKQVRIPFPQRDAVRECNGRVVSTSPDESPQSPYSVSIFIKEKEGSQRELFKITDRVQSNPHAARITPINPQFTSECSYIVFCVGDQIMISDVFGKKVFQIGKGIEPYLFRL